MSGCVKKGGEKNFFVLVLDGILCLSYIAIGHCFLLLEREFGRTSGSLFFFVGVRNFWRWACL